MIKLNTYINETWSGVKKHTNNAEIEAWCEEMGIKNYTINSKGEIDVDGSVNLNKSNFKELPYKFGRVNGYFDIGSNPNLTSLKNCPNYVGSYFSCKNCHQLDSLEGCPKEVSLYFYCRKCKREFTKEGVVLLCNISKKDIFVQYNFILTFQ